MDSYAIKKAESEFAQKRLNASFDFSRKKEEFYTAHPEYAALEHQKRLVACSRDLSKDEKHKRIADINKQMDRFLTDNGLKFPEIKYSCPNCRDEGKINGEYCPCFTRRLIEISLSSDLLCDENACFENFDINIFNESDRKKMADIKDYCAEYAKKFPDVKRPNLILSGNTGTGKTFLLSSISLELRKRGIGVVYITAGRMFDILRRYAFDRINDIDLLLDADMLMIDDLGTEPIFNNITQEYIFMLINERTRLKMPICISTNLVPDDIKARYTERVFSRLMDKSLSCTLRLADTDLRLKKL